MQAEKDRIQAIQDALTAKGIQQSDYGPIRHALNEMAQLQQNIAAERGQQFIDDAFAATAGLGLSRDQVAIVAAYMRRFAEKVATSQAVQNATPASDIPAVVDQVTQVDPTA